MSPDSQPAGASPAGPGQQAQAITHLPVQLKGSTLAHKVLAGMGWTVDFEGLPALQGVLVVYPHTSNWDFIYAILTKWAIGMPVAFWAKHSLLEIPLLGRWMRWIGAVAVRRNSPQGAVGDMQRQIEQARSEGRFMWLALAPEGTRSLTDGWRSGFYQVATGAKVPLALGHVNYATRHVGIMGYLQLTGNPDVDMAAIAKAYEHVRGYEHALAAPIRLKK